MGRPPILDKVGCVLSAPLIAAERMVLTALALFVALLLSPLASVALALPEDRYEPNDSRSVATRIVPPWTSDPSNYDLEISSSSDEDWFVFSTVEGGLVSVTVRADAWGLSCELYGSGSSGSRLKSGITDNIGWESLYLTAPATGSYYLRFVHAVSTSSKVIKYRVELKAPAIPTPSVFWDVPAAHPYASAIEQLAARDVVDGQTDGSFGLYQMIFRQQFAKMLVNVLGFAPTEADVCHFPDVDKPSTSLYPDNYVAVAAKHGLVTGYADGRFGPYDSITRAQVLTMVVRAAPLAGLQLSEPDSAYYTSGVNRNFNDPTHGHNAQLAEFNGLCGGLMLDPDYRWNPWVVATRGEVAQVLWRLVYLSGR